MPEEAWLIWQVEFLAKEEMADPRSKEILGLMTYPHSGTQLKPTGSAFCIAIIRRLSVPGSEVKRKALQGSRKPAWQACRLVHTAEAASVPEGRGLQKSRGGAEMQPRSSEMPRAIPLQM